MIRLACVLLTLVSAAPAAAETPDGAEASELPATPEQPVTPEKREKPGPSIYAEQLLGIAIFPAGILSQTIVEYRIPGPRSKSPLLQKTYFGIGGRFETTPAYIDIGPRISFAPVDVFDMDIQGVWTWYIGPFAPLPFDEVENRMEPKRQLREGENVPLHKFELTLSPTVKLKVGPVIAFSATHVGFVKAIPPDGVETPYWFELARSMVLGWNEITLVNQTSVLAELLDGKGKPMFWLGATMRHRNSVVSKDENTGIGPMLFFKPSDGKFVPTFIMYALFHVVDRERLGRPPNSALAATWTFDRKIKAIDVLTAR